MAITGITHVTVLVEDTDEARDWYRDRLGFELRTDEEFAPGARFCTVAPADSDVEIVLQEPTESAFGEETASELRQRIGEATMTVLGTDDCRGTIETFRDREVTVTSDPEPVPWGLSAIVEDLYGNPYNVVEPR